MKILSIVTSSSIYHCCSTRKTFWEEKFTLDEFTSLNMQNFGHRNVRKYREIKNGEKYITLDIFLKFVSLDKMQITLSEPKYYLRRSVKGLITSLVLKNIVMSKKKKNLRYTITNVIMTDISKIVKEFEKLHYVGYVQKRTKQEPTKSYFCLARQLNKSTMRADDFNFHVNPARMEMTGTLHIHI